MSRSQKTLLKTETKLNYFAFNINSVFVSTDSNLNVVADLGELSFRAVSPALSNRRGSQCSQVKMKISNIPCFTMHLIIFKHICSVCAPGDPAEVGERGGPEAGSLIQQGSV